MNRQGKRDRGLLRGRKLILLVATALVVLAAPAAANATVYVAGEDHTEGGEHVHLYIFGDSADNNLTVTSTSTTLTVTGATMDATQDDSFGDHCSGTTTVTCIFLAGDDVLLDAYLDDGNDTIDASGASGHTAFYPLFDGEGGNDVITGTPFDDLIGGGPGSDLVHSLAGFDYLAMADNQTDQVGSDCGDGYDELERDFADPAIANCETVSTFNTPAPPPSNSFTFGSFKGSSLSINAPGPGLLTSGPANGAGASRLDAIAAKKKKPLVSTAKVTVPAAGSYKLPVKLTSAGKKQLKKKKKLKVKVKVTFTPVGGTPASQIKTVTFKKKK